MRRKRNFNGCWTCRIRKVKCDAMRPTCERCAKAGIECEGYGIKLAFYQLLTIKNDELIDIKTDDIKYHRRTIDFCKFPRSQLYETFDELDDIVHKLSEFEGKQNFSIGPFAVYHDIKGKASEKLPIGNEKAINSILDNTIQEISPTPDEPEETTIKVRSNLIHEDLLKYAKLSIYGIKGTNYKINDQNIYHILYPTFYPNIDSDDWQPKDYFTYLIDKSNGIHLSDQFLTIIRNFKNIEFSFCKVKFEDPWKIHVMPYLQNMIFEFLIDLPTESLTGELKKVIVYLIISLNSFMLSKDKYNKIDENIKISINCRKISLNLLNYHLDEYDSNVDMKNDEYNVLLLICIILQIEIDTYLNIFENFELLFSIGEFISIQDNHNKEFSNLRLIIFTIFKIMYTFFISTQRVTQYNYQISDKHMVNYRDLNDDYDLSKVEFENPVIIEDVENDKKSLLDDEDYNNYDNDDFEPEKSNVLSENSIYLMYGLPKSLIALFEQMVHLTNHKRIFKIQSKYSRNFPKLCSEIEEKLETWEIKWKLGDSKFHKMLRLNIEIFHCSLKVYYNRLIKNEVHQHLIDRIFKHIDELTQLSGINNDIKLPYWIMVIISCDNNSTDTFNKKLFNHTSTYWRSKQVMIEINNRKLTDPISWMELIREWDIILYLG